jgi:hypothetical protein
MFDKIDMTLTNVWKLIYSDPVYNVRGEIPVDIRCQISPHFFTDELSLLDHVYGHTADNIATQIENDPFRII